MGSFILASLVLEAKQLEIGEPQLIELKGCVGILHLDENDVMKSSSKSRIWGILA